MRGIIWGLLIFLVAQSAMAGDQVPYAEKVSAKIVNYHRHTPSIATSGAIKLGGLEELKSLGFKTLLDLRTVKEGTQTEKQAAAKSGLGYYNLPVSKDFPSSATFAQFKALVENKDNYPLLIHCASANRVGMVWAYYRIKNGIEAKAAIAEGRAIGMRPAREQQLQENLLTRHSNRSP